MPRGTPAHAAGINVEDELIALNRVRIGDLEKDLGRYRGGETVEVTLARRGRLRTLKVELGAPPEESWKLRVVDEPSPAQRIALSAWLDNELGDKTDIEISSPSRDAGPPRDAAAGSRR